MTAVASEKSNSVQGLCTVLAEEHLMKMYQVVGQSSKSVDTEWPRKDRRVVHRQQIVPYRIEDLGIGQV